eukprot:gene7318-8136_t
MAFTDVRTLQKLSELLKPPEELNDGEGQVDETHKPPHLTPASIGKSQNSSQQNASELTMIMLCEFMIMIMTSFLISRLFSVASKKETKNESKDIWDADEAIEGNFDDDEEMDERQCPEYEVLFKQKVTTDDVFLGMTGKNQSTACCEDLLVRVQLPNTERQEIDLDVQDTFLSCRSPKFRLALHLPSKVDSKNGKADWDRNKQILAITLPLKREYDFMNM